MTKIKEPRVLILDKEDWLAPELGPGRADDHQIFLGNVNGDGDGCIMCRNINRNLFFVGYGIGDGNGNGDGMGYGCL